MLDIYCDQERVEGSSRMGKVSVYELVWLLICTSTIVRAVYVRLYSIIKLLENGKHHNSMRWQYMVWVVSVAGSYISVTWGSNSAIDQWSGCNECPRASDLMRDQLVVEKPTMQTLTSKFPEIFC